MNLLNTISETIVDGEGIRYSIYLAGCGHKCPGCQNPASWNPEAGEPLTDERLDKIVEEVKSNPLLDGITISGGDPFYNPEGLLCLLRRLKTETELNIWCYTGYTIEAILRDDRLRPALTYIDTLVDGPFVKSLYSPYLDFRGSSNQRIIDVQAYLESIEDITQETMLLTQTIVKHTM